MALTSEDSIKAVEQFMSSPLVIWFESCLGDIVPASHKLSFEELVDGVLIYSVFLKMDIHGQINDVTEPSDSEDDEQRLKNLQTIMRNMRLFYEEDSVLLREPELQLIARAAHSNVCEVELLLILLLGCAVKCPNQLSFIEKIKLLEVTTQEVIASHIKKVTHFPDVVLCRDMLLIEMTDPDDSLAVDEPKTMHAQKVYKAFEEIRRINMQRLELLERDEAVTGILSTSHCRRELEEWKSKALQLRRIEEEYMEEVRSYSERLLIFETDNARLASEAKAAKEYRDALDVAMEKSARTEQLEREVARYKDKMDHLHGCKKRLEEIKQDNRLLVKNTDELAAQLDVYKSRAERVLAVETQLRSLQEKSDRLVLENEALKKRTSELTRVNDELEQRLKAAAENSAIVLRSSGSDESLNTSFDNSICEQLSRSDNSKVLKLELQNRRLRHLVESLWEKSSHESSDKMLELERENESLRLANDILAAEARELEEYRTKEASGVKNDDNDDQLNSSVLKSPLENDLREAQLKIKEQTETIVVVTREHENLKNDFALLMEEYHKSKSSLERLRRMGKSSRMLRLQIECSNLQQRCELLGQLNERAEADKRGLREYVSKMLDHNQRLVAQSFKDKQNYHKEELKNNETVNNLCRAKQKLEEKIMDQFRRMDNKNSFKKRSAAMNAMRSTFIKVRRAGSDLFNRSRRSLSEDISTSADPTVKADDFEFSRPSDASSQHLPKDRKSIDSEHFVPAAEFFCDDKNTC